MTTEQLKKGKEVEADLARVNKIYHNLNQQYTANGAAPGGVIKWEDAQFLIKHAEAGLKKDFAAL